MKTSVDSFGVEGAALLAALHARCFAAPWGEAEMARLLDSTGVEGLVVRAGDDPAGLVLVRAIAGEAEILTLGVDPARRRAGLGAVLVQACLATARQRQAARIYLEVSEINTAALALYAAAGFAQVGRREGYYRTGDAALVLARGL